jgi:hypothetical protein
MLKIFKRIAKHTDIIEYIIMYVGFISMISVIIYNLIFHY